VRRAVAAGLTLLIVWPGSAMSWAGWAKEREMPPTIQDVKARHAPRLLALPGVVSVGIGRAAEGHEVIVVGLDRPRPETQADLPTLLEGYPVRVEIIGAVRAH
jgi:hypothetical protein